MMICEIALGKVLEVARAIEGETEYPEMVGPLCKFCDFLEICDAGRELQPVPTDI